MKPMGLVFPLLLLAATCVLSSGEPGNRAERNAGMYDIDTDVHRYKDNDCKKKKVLFVVSKR